MLENPVKQGNISVHRLHLLLVDLHADDLQLRMDVAVELDDLVDELNVLVVAEVLLDL